MQNFRPALEQMEERINPYTATGNAWTTPDLVTVSIAPDATWVVGNAQSDLFAEWNAKFGSSAVWQKELLRAAQTWAMATNLDFSLISDNGAIFGTGDYQEGDPNFGDIRIGGYSFGGSTLAWGQLPPPGTNYSIAGDIAFNTDQNFGIGGGYDIYSVALHEIGHALGLGHSTVGVMRPVYSGAGGLDSDAQAGIRSIYGGARTVDAYDAAGSNNSFANASNLTSTIDTTNKNAVIDGLDITNQVTDTDFYKFTVPSDMGGSASLKVVSAGRSLLAPKFYLYNASQQQIGYVTGLNQYGTTLTINQNLTAGATYYMKVMGADYTVFGGGSYAITMQFNGGATPTLANLDVSIANGSPIQHAGSYNQEGGGCGCPYCDGAVKDVPAVISGIKGDNTSEHTNASDTPTVAVTKGGVAAVAENAKEKETRGTVRRDLAHKRDGKSAIAHRLAMKEWLSQTSDENG